MKQNEVNNALDPAQNPFAFIWLANCVIYSVVVAYLVMKDRKKKWTAVEKQWRRAWWEDEGNIERFHSRDQHLWKFIKTKESFYIKRDQLPQDWFGTPTWPLFYCFGTPIWRPWRHVKTLYTLTKSNTVLSVLLSYNTGPVHAISHPHFLAGCPWDFLPSQHFSGW